MTQVSKLSPLPTKSSLIHSSWRRNQCFSKAHGIVVEAYSPLGSTGAPLLENPVIEELATKYKVPPATILISWHVNKGRVVLPKSVTPSRIKTNAEWIKLEDEDIVTLDKLSEKFGTKRIVKPDWGVDLKFPDWKQ